MHRHQAQNALLLRLVLLLTLVLSMLPASALAQETPPAATPQAQPEPAPTATPATVVPVDYEASFEETECPFVLTWDQRREEIVCGLLSVPENRYNPDYAAGEDTIQLFVTILLSRSRPLPDPVLVVTGGPDDAASALRTYVDSLVLREDRDIILLDPRGAGYSTPSLDCPEVSDPEAGFESSADAYAACHERLIEEGRDLSGYRSAEMVEDVADLATVLGIGSLNLYSVAYGSRVAVLLADRYPSLVRSMVLDSPVPVSVNALLEEPLYTYGVFRRIAQDCADDRQCNGTYPALEPRLLEVIDRYNRTPLPESIGYGSGDDLLRFMLGALEQGGRSLPAFITALYDEDFPRACAALPITSGCRFEAETAAGSEEQATSAEAASSESAPWRTLLETPENPDGPDAERISWLMEDLEYATPEDLFAWLDTLSLARAQRLLAQIPASRSDFFSEGLFASVVCAEEAPFFTTADVAEVARRIPAQFGTLPVQRANDVAALCAFWQMPALSPARKVLLEVTTPALIVAGTHDPLTPPAWSRIAAATLREGSVHFFPGVGHAVLSTGNECMVELMTDFFADPMSRLSAPCSDDLSLDFYFADEEEPLP